LSILARFNHTLLGTSLGLELIISCSELLYTAGYLGRSYSGSLRTNLSLLLLQINWLSRPSIYWSRDNLWSSLLRILDLLKVGCLDRLLLAIIRLLILLLVRLVLCLIILIWLLRWFGLILISFRIIIDRSLKYFRLNTLIMQLRHQEPLIIIEFQQLKPRFRWMILIPKLQEQHYMH